VYDALTSRRPFRQPMYPAEAMAYMDSKAGNMFDPEILAAFRQVVSLYPSGIGVELDSGVRCIVMKNYPHDTSRPCLRLINHMSAAPLLVDLHMDASYKNTYIAKIIDLD
jgi:HD-GYP domain-containing protein (c-di-GMP phosphodiesterase class II)